MRLLPLLLLLPPLTLFQPLPLPLRLRLLLDTAIDVRPFQSEVWAPGVGVLFPTCC